MKEITFFLIRAVSILLFLKAILLLEELYHGIRATYFSERELVEMTYPSILYFLVSIGLWVIAGKLTYLFCKGLNLQDAEIGAREIKEILVNTIGVLYLLTTIPDLILFVLVSSPNFVNWGMDYISKIDAILLCVHIVISLYLIFKPKHFVKIINIFNKAQ